MKEKFKFVVDNSIYVKIDYTKLDEFINNLGELNYKHWSKNHNLDLTEKEWIILAFLIESMNFCFWIKPKWKIEYHNDILSGSNALFYSVIKEVENNKDFLDINYLYNLKYEDFKKIFTPVEGEIPLIENRFNNFKEVVNVIHNDSNFFTELFNINSDQELLKFITSKFISFDDKSLYKGEIIYFNKRATLLVNDLYYLSDTIRKNIKNVNNLSGCADYGIPRTFRDYGILEYNNILAEKVDNEEEILHDSNMEIEIRANMLYVIELIKEKLQEKGILINSIELDNLIWVMGKKQTKKSNAHHTITIYY